MKILRQTSILTTLLATLLTLVGCQTAVTAQTPEESLQKDELKGLLVHLASDKMAGRRTGEPGNNMAASFIADYFRDLNIREFPDAPGYLQTIPLVQIKPASHAEMSLLGRDFKQGENLLVMAGGPLDVKAGVPVVVAGYGVVDPENGVDDYAGLDVDGKVVLVKFGTPDDNSPMAAMSNGPWKTAWAHERGAIALVEIYEGAFPWDRMLRFMNRSRLTADSEMPLPYFLINPENNILEEASDSSATASISSSGIDKRATPSSNVVGWIEGTDPVKKNEYILLSAHYDHVGIGEPRPEAPADSIYNGTRDNAMGTVAVMAAAKALSQSPPERSVIFLALTGEEVGLLGSAYYADHPLVPLEKTVFNLNIDGAGYTDTSIVTVIGLERTTAETSIRQAVQDFGLEAITDPVPEQNLFNRSDNVSFARKGVPAPTFSLGFRNFDAEIMKYYHQPTDEADDVDYDYFLKYCQAYARATRYIGAMPEAPFWKDGDDYEEAGNQLYGSR